MLQNLSIEQKDRAIQGARRRIKATKNSRKDKTVGYLRLTGEIKARKSADKFKAKSVSRKPSPL